MKEIEPNRFVFVTTSLGFLKTHRFDLLKELVERKIQVAIVCEEKRCFSSEQSFVALGIKIIPILKFPRGDSVTQLWEDGRLLRSALKDMEGSLVVHSISMRSIVLTTLICSFPGLQPKNIKAFCCSITGFGVFRTHLNLRLVMGLFLIRMASIVFIRLNRVKYIYQTQSDNNFGKKMFGWSGYVLGGIGVQSHDFVSNVTRSLHSKVRITFCSRLLVSKGVFDFVSVIASARLRIGLNVWEGVEVSLLGKVDVDHTEAVDLDRLTTMCDMMGIDLKLNCSSQEVYSELERSDVFFMASSYGEGMPKVLMEASAKGCAIVLAWQEGYADYFSPGVNCLTYQPGDLMEAVEKLQKIVCDLPLRIRLAEMALQTGRREFTAESYIEKQMLLYSSNEMISAK